MLVNHPLNYLLYGPVSTIFGLDGFLLDEPSKVSQMNDKIESESEERSLQIMKKILIIGGTLFVLVGLFRQWPILGKTYFEFIEGKGYLSLILGLIMIVLGFSIRLLAGETEDPS